MKIKLFFSILGILFWVACNTDSKKSDAYGTFEATERIIAAESGGKILAFAINEGDEIEANKMLGYIDTTELFLKKEQLKSQKKAIASKVSTILSQISVQNEQKKTLNTEWERLQKLYKDGAATDKQLDNVSGQMAVIEKQILSIESQNSSVINEIKAIDKQIEQIDYQIKKCMIVNPVLMTVLEKYVETYEICTPGKALYKGADLSKMFLRVYVSEQQLSSIKIGQQVKVLVDAEQGTFKNLTGNISWISKQAEFTPKIIQTKEERINLVYAVKISVENKAGILKIGMPGEVVF